MADDFRKAIEREQCPDCGGELDTGWECNKCGADWRNHVRTIDAAKSEAEEYRAIKRRVDELMSGGPLGDGIGPGNTCWHVNREFGATYTPEEIHAIWQKGKPWYKGDARLC